MPSTAQVMFVRHYASREVTSGMLTMVGKGRMNYLKLCEAIFSQDVSKEGR